MEQDFLRCSCNEPLCSKCLSVNCEDKDCTVHTALAKMRWHKNRETSEKKLSTWGQKLWKRAESAIFAIIAKFKKTSENI